MNLFKVLTIVYIYVVEKSAPIYLQELFELVPPSSRSMRSNDIVHKLKMKQPRRRTLGERSINVAIAQLWNDLPSNIKLCSSLEMFKKQLKTHLIR